MKHANKIYSAIIALIFSVMTIALQSCGSKEEPTPPQPPVTPEVPRTVLVYMVATNNLGTGLFDASDIREMQEAATKGGLKGGRLVLYHASPDGIVLKEVTDTGIDTLKVYDNSELSVSVSRMRQVIKDVKEIAPAKDYGLVLWSHATGWLQDGIEEPQTKGYRSFGSDGLNNGKTMNITSLAEAVEYAGFSFIYFDCCYMGSVEVMYEMRKCAPYMVVSAAEIHAEGMPYQVNIPNLFDTTCTTEELAKKAAKTTFDYYNDIFSKGDCPCTFAVVRSDKMQALADKTREIYNLATSSVAYGVSYQKFKVNGICYYYDLDQYVESVSVSDDLLQEWRDALNDAVIYAEASPWIWSSLPVERFCGLTTNIIANQDGALKNNYNTLSWYTDVASALWQQP